MPCTESSPPPRPDQWDDWHRTGLPFVVSCKEAEFFCRHLAPRPGLRAVDLACGNGQWTRQLAAWGLTVRGYDFSAEALRQATAAGVHEDLAYARWDIDRDPAPAGLAAGTLDLVTCRYALPYLRHARLLPDIARWLRPGGAFYALVHLRDGTEDAGCRRRRGAFRGALTPGELDTVGADWPYRSVHRLSRRKTAIVLRPHASRRPG
ncbi:class I SAM-dependent methyltransferase [Streptomyces sp. NPDC090106]|uniref:class I SAM-dependent methyltransferase n=1 Tax=Streptomyces sp. NPDC090106 TaxID=3365946 RepID=UPI0038001CBB